MSQNHDHLIVRLEQLERENRRIKRVGGSLLAGVGLVGLMSFAFPRLCDTVWAERFVLQDSRGKSRMVLNAYGTQTPSITFNDQAGKGVASLQIEREGDMSLNVFKQGHDASFRFTPENIKGLGSSCEHVKGDEDKSIN